MSLRKCWFCTHRSQHFTSLQIKFEFQFIVDFPHIHPECLVKEEVIMQDPHLRREELASHTWWIAECLYQLFRIFLRRYFYSTLLIKPMFFFSFFFSFLNVCKTENYFNLLGATLVAQTVKPLLAMQETWVWSLGGEDPLEKEMMTPPILLPGKLHGLKFLIAYSPWGLKESDKTERLHFLFLLAIIQPTIQLSSFLLWLLRDFSMLLCFYFT